MVVQPSKSWQIKIKPNKVMKLRSLLIFTSISFLLYGCGGGNIEEALNADNTDESASDLISFFEKSDPNIKKIAKTASDAKVEPKDGAKIIGIAAQGLSFQGRLIRKTVVVIEGENIEETPKPKQKTKKKS